MKRIIFILLIFLTACGGGSHDYAEQNKTYLWIGQSNAAGRAEITEENAGYISNAYLLNDEGEWEDFRSPANRYSNIRGGLSSQMLGLAHGFVKAMSEDGTVRVIVNAKGAKTIDFFLPGNPGFDKTIERIKGVKIDGIMWHQGESNVVEGDISNYMTDLAYMIEAFRNEFGNIPVVVGQIASWRDDSKEFNNMLLTAPAYIDNIAVVSSEGLTGIDSWHFDADSYIEYGKRYATALGKI